MTVLHLAARFGHVDVLEVLRGKVPWSMASVKVMRREEKLLLNSFENTCKCLCDTVFILLFVACCFADWFVRSSRGRSVRSDRSSQRNASQGVRHNQKRVSFDDG